MNETIFIVYSVDDDHTVKSRQVIAVCTVYGFAVMYCVKYARQDMTNESKDISAADVELLNSAGQTESYQGEGQLLILEHPVNTLIV